MGGFWIENVMRDRRVDETTSYKYAIWTITIAAFMCSILFLSIGSVYKLYSFVLFYVNVKRVALILKFFLNSCGSSIFYPQIFRNRMRVAFF